MSKEAKEAFDRFIGAFLDNPLQNINERLKRGRTVLHYAAQLSDAGVIRLLIEEGANINARDDNGETALHLAAFSGKVENVKALLEGGAEVNAISNNRAVPLHLACLARRIKTIEVLINSGGNIDAIDKFGCSPLSYAKIYPKVTSHLEKKGVNMRDVPPMYGKANEAVKEIMERRGTKVVSLDEIEEILLSEKTSQKG
ncbi:ankyrin repeat domain-containing protein [Wolbachia endosymbiont of Cimex lectularius]|uniref:ankyrin repeat domain-containing protein n=1 Tax=Wolbachia endosymbiont of Cimex lectularius TaxID=246273 RepID=UPI00049AEFA2|nr:ankyrin repeat domain-containing protein [Wolbachia endosymbiont of Cimex lectularius]BAO99583.1 ankyrin repeat domain protein [Wolbachia endosymbiont of Cimex lectularius]